MASISAGNTAYGAVSGNERYAFSVARNRDERSLPGQTGGMPGETVQTPSRQEGVQLNGPSPEEFRPYGSGGLPVKQQGKSVEGEQSAADVRQDKGAEGGAVPGTGSPGEKSAIGSDKKLDDPQVQAVVAKLKSTEDKVKAHEAAHKAAGGTMTGPISYSYTRGPDGKNYVTGGEVPIKISSGKTPEETIARMQQVVQAALAPSDPSPQDRAVAAQASAMEQQARTEKTSSSGTAEGGNAAEAGAAAGTPNQGEQPGESDSGSDTEKSSVKGTSGAVPPSSPGGEAPPVTPAGQGSRDATGSDTIIGRISRSAYGSEAVAGNGRSPERGGQPSSGAEAAGPPPGRAASSERTFSPFPTSPFIPAQSAAPGTLRPVSLYA